ncbi:hypothetical protein [Actinoplanes teichomyceticus]|uniref:Uncharacterized protein n=1 Tax=Actinoplanes teichomyceticus TaxID=1867 RepID=A0A561WKW3_ACTTI|nr:hypothetical protein [Actinoplanes teichomyceticus]TWG24507.1 hypothetical protein FHX34_1021067 [Actinoplanes teichomyceticus]GIF16803.1 hypothetical protein Ate01nite_68350 [Actinoplanes teichomyceticus]
MTTNAPEQVRTDMDPDSSPSRLRQAVTTVRTSRPAQAVSTHRKPAAGLLALAGAAAALFLLRKRTTKPVPSGWRSAIRRR